jgi:hypothetical protein
MMLQIAAYLSMHSSSHNDAARICHSSNSHHIRIHFYILLPFLDAQETLAFHVDDSAANPIWPSSDPWCAAELLFRAASKRSNVC